MQLIMGGLIVLGNLLWVAW